MPERPAAPPAATERIKGFPPLVGTNPRLLVLGSMPSRESLARHRYYAHPRNAFWPLLTDLLGISASDYDGRVREVTARGIAVWDVLRDCIRPGSLDSAIEEKTASTNDFNAFFSAHTGIALIAFNGTKAESLYRRRVLPVLEPHFIHHASVRLPSTSPANAGMNYEQKKNAWRVLLDPGLE
jgi:hypoxanthine-DNA glycosylase